MLREAHAFFCQPVDVWSLEMLLSVATQIAVPEVIGDDIDDIGGPYFFFLPLRATRNGNERYEERQK
jgi:hypothetical protein